MDDIYARLRGRQDRRGGPGADPRSPTQSPAFVGRAFAGRAVPTTTGCFFSVHPVTVLGAEGEANPGSLTPDTSTTVLAYVTGGRPPVAGDDLICRFIGNRWIADRIVPSGGIAIGGCACTSIPSTLQMSSSRPSSDGGMFQGCTLQFGNTPPEYGGLSLGAQCYLSTTSFTDPSGDSFRYHFYCVRSQLLLSRVYANSILGSPFEDSVRYSWAVGPLNTCTPFLMSSGHVYSGGDAGCVVTISA